MGEQFLNERQAEGSRLASAGLGEADQIATFEEKRDCLRLNGRWRFNAELKKRGDDRLDTEQFKISQVITFRAPKRCAGSHHAVRSRSGVKNPA